MNELQPLSGPEMFPEDQQQPYNSYLDTDEIPSQMGVQSDVAGQVSNKEHNFEALREEAAKFKAEREYWRGQAEALANKPAHQTASQEQPSQLAQELDWEDSNDVRKAWQQVREENERLRHEMRDSFAAVHAKTQHQDWNQLVTQHVPQLTSQNPIFAEMIERASNPYEAAYQLAALNARNTMPQSQDGARAIANASKPQTLSSVGGRGQLSAADYYASMSDEDFMKIASKNLASI